MLEELQRPNNCDQDELVMSLVEMALSRPPNEREAYLRSACAERPELFEETMSYVLCEQRMNGFLLEPLLPPPPREQLLLPGNLLQGRFRIVKEVAQGGMGVVYEARDEKLERRIAIKCAKAGFGKRLPPEVRNASEISHPNVCKIFEIHTASIGADEIDFLTMEFLEGETLADRLRSGPIEEKEAKIIAKQLCDGLEEAHRNQVIHGDLKSNNVILTKGANGETRAVITDFGLASKAAAARFDPQSGTLAGTPDYMAPELLKGGKASTASDLYALGVILFEVAIGRKPCPPQATWEERIVQKPPSVKHPWNSIFQRCLDPDPAKRCSDPAEVRGVVAPPASRRKGLAAMAATVVLAIAFSLWMYTRATAPQETFSLAVLPFEATPQTASLADKALHELTTDLSRIKGNQHTKFTFLPSANSKQKVDTPEKARALLGATHVLRVTLKQEKQVVVLHAYVTDTKSENDLREWKADYAPEELRFLPVALTGVVTATLQLPPLVKQPVVSPAARQDYLNGLLELRYDSNMDRAVELLGKAVSEDPDSPLTHAALADAEFFKYKLTGGPQAQVWLERTKKSEGKAARRNPDLAPVHRVTALLAKESSSYDYAIEENLRAIELDPKNGDVYRRLAQTYEARGKIGEALKEYRRAVDVEPTNYRSQQSLGAIFYKTADYNEAVLHYRKAVDLAPKEPRPRFALAGAYLNLGQFLEAERELILSIKLQERSDAELTMGLVLMYQRREQEAIPYFLTALKLDSQEPLCDEYLGICYRRTNRIAEANRANRDGLEMVEGKIARDPNNGILHSYMAYFSATFDDRHRAESEIAQAKRFAPGDARMLWTAVLTFEALKDHAATIELLQGAPSDLLEDLNRWPDLAELQQDSRFKELLASHQAK